MACFASPGCDGSLAAGLMMGDPETWLGNIERAVGVATDLERFYCSRCGIVHGPGECLRGDL